MMKKLNTYGLEMNGLNETAAASKRLQGGYSGHYFQIFYDTSDGQVFYAEHASRDSYTGYDDPDIKNIINIFKPVTRQEIADRINEYLNA